jgi:protein-tyrosine phosphatase
LIDIHSHVLPGIDDGASSLDVSLAMLRLAGKHGTTDIVATPHANLEYQFRPDRIAELWRELQASNDSGVAVHLGCDFHLAYENIEDALRHPRKYTIAGGAYLLVEFSDLIILKTTGQIFSDLLGHGMRPVITHPERNLLLQKRVDDLRDWVGMGCGIQVTAQSLLGDFGSKARKFSELLMDQGLVHVIASDAHDPVHRPPLLDRAYGYVESEWGRETAEHLFVANPRAVLESGEWQGLPQKRKRGFFGFFR